MVVLAVLEELMVVLGLFQVVAAVAAVVVVVEHLEPEDRLIYM
tara:strand:- start:112 stop:240 length:129 start_codon:yes stop_codon:yes gene_type:complete